MYNFSLKEINTFIHQECIKLINIQELQEIFFKVIFMGFYTFNGSKVWVNNFY